MNGQLLDDVLRTDAQFLALKHKGEFDRLLRDPDVRVTKFARAPRSVLDAQALDYGVDEVMHVTSLGLCTYEKDGSHTIMIYDRLSPSEELRVRAHEVGHARARTLLNDRSEHAARVWGQAWQRAALRVQLDLAERH